MQSNITILPLPLNPHPNFKNLLGQTFSRLSVIGYSGRAKTGKSLWVCKCECGEIRVFKANLLTRGKTTSCGCYHREKAASLVFKHGGTGTPEYRVWRNIIERCENPQNKGYVNYGGRGIGICRQWRHSFENFIADMGNRPSPKHSIDRIDNDGNYEPSNCHWATRKEQNNNRRTNCNIEFRGVTRTLSEWADALGIKEATLRCRIRYYEWSIEKAILTPVKQ